MNRPSDTEVNRTVILLCTYLDICKNTCIQWLRGHILEGRNVVDARASGASACGRLCHSIYVLSTPVISNSKGLYYSFDITEFL